MREWWGLMAVTTNFPGARKGLVVRKEESETEGSQSIGTTSCCRAAPSGSHLAAVGRKD